MDRILLCLSAKILGFRAGGESFCFACSVNFDFCVADKFYSHKI
ncbi:hypothetical protein CAMGR0001_1006 [Campylobacter gracilis RM3268]|uniref:Uncharacterized protein n=1 Tax=Campylobacter gracilis RM3268 TaxID=553220 RepID=C8PGL1_9BACT|nr:hypothetical protein CAMGR0001_1006 [Campylobacter gracilis RM3268]